METGIYLTALVFGVGFVHLAVQAASFMSSGKKAQSEKQKNVVRDDWYMFFHRSQLTGIKEEEIYPTQAGMTKKKTARKARPVQKRAQVRI